MVFIRIYGFYMIYMVYMEYIGNVIIPTDDCHKMTISLQIRHRLCFAMGSQRDAKIQGRKETCLTRISTVIRSWLLVLTCYSWL